MIVFLEIVKSLVIHHLVGLMEVKNNGNIKTYKVDTGKVASSTNTGIFQRTAESFLNSLGKKPGNANVDLSKYEQGVKVYHKKSLVKE